MYCILYDTFDVMRECWATIYAPAKYIIGFKGSKLARHFSTAKYRSPKRAAFRVISTLNIKTHLRSSESDLLSVIFR
jgi:hypothetical protein